MTEQHSNSVNRYLAQLDAALDGVDPGVHAEIVAGISEEFAGLDEAGATQRIADLGDPALIAAEARAGMPSTATAMAGAMATEPAPGRISSIIAVLVLIVGSFVVPVLGTLVGLVWVSFSPAWSRREKLYTWLIPIASMIVIAVVLALTAAGQVAPTESAGVTNPVIFGGGGHLAILIPFVIFPIEGIALLIRAHRRSWATTPSALAVSVTG